MLLRLSVGLSLITLLVLAGLQYHWIGQIAAAERLRLERGVAESSEELVEDFSAELRNLTGALIPRFSLLLDPASVSARYREWETTTAYPNLVESLFIVHSPLSVLQLDSSTGEFEPTPWPDHLLPSEEFFDGRLAFGDLEKDLILLPLNRRLGGRGGGRGALPPGELNGRDFGGPRNGQDRDVDDEGWIIAELNHDVIVNQILPRLVDRRFADYEGRDYRVAVVASRPDFPEETIFTSGSPWTPADLRTPDYQLDLSMPLPGQQRRGGPGLSTAPQRGGRAGDRGPRAQEARVATVSFAGQRWRLLVKHRTGSLEAAVMEFRNRNIAISFGVLVILGISAAVIVISGSRARRLGELQMEFAAGISHELRTPLAVIQSAAHNLGSGVVRDQQGVEEYAAIVQTEARRLKDMVEQVMAYTETQSGRKRYDLTPVDAGDVAEVAIRNMSNLLQEGHATLESDIQPGLPPVMADGPALTRCLQNLLSNAVKYGRNGNSARISLEGRYVPESGTPGKVQLIVTDHGPGVPDNDVKQLFKPFFRGSNANTNTPGNGLGLHLVDRIMEAQNGSVSYEPATGGGARFILTLQAAGSPA